MRLYARTLLFFLGAIAFQALLTAGLIVGLVTRNNRNLARMELREESLLIHDNYFAWVRAMWRRANAIRMSDDIAALAAVAQDSTGEILLVNRVERELHDSGMDSFVIRRGNWNHFEIIAEAYPYIDDFSPLHMDRNHPYIALKTLDSNVFLVASIPLPSKTEVFLLKHIDDDFYDRLKSRDHVRVFLSSDTARMRDRVSGGMDPFAILKLDEVYPPYREFFDLNLGQGHYNVSIRNIGFLEGSGELKLLVFMSNDPYSSLLVQIGRIVLIGSIVTAVLTAIVALFFTGRLTRPIHDLVAATGRVRDGNLSISVSTTAQGEVRDLMEGFNSMVHHLKENRITLDANLREITFLKEYNETIIQSLRAGIVIVDAQLKVEMVNGVIAETFGLIEGDISGVSLRSLKLEILDDEIFSMVDRVTRGTLENWSKVTRGRDAVWETRIYPLRRVKTDEGKRCVLEIIDVSRKIDLEEKILQAERLSSLSFLSAGIAHEVNNPLSTILSTAQQLMVKADETDRPGLEWIEKETKRIAGIVRKLLNFSHETPENSERTDVNNCIEDVLTLIRYSLPKNGSVSVEMELHPDTPPITLPTEELRQVILNLVQNAVQAVGQRGLIRIATFKKDDNSVQLNVSDNGPGIPKGVESRIFDPFFTTKPDGVGTGLGLSIVYGILKKAGGDIAVASRQGGTEFILSLPVWKDET